MYQLCRTTYIALLYKPPKSILQIATLLRRKGWEYVKKELLHEVLRSTTFLSLNGGLFATFLCLTRYIQLL